jgi:hypothetical protein
VFTACAVPIVLATGMIKALLWPAGVALAVLLAAPVHADPDTDPTMQNIGLLDTLNKHSIRTDTRSTTTGGGFVRPGATGGQDGALATRLSSAASG